MICSPTLVLALAIAALLILLGTACLCRLAVYRYIAVSSVIAWSRRRGRQFKPRDVVAERLPL